MTMPNKPWIAEQEDYLKFLKSERIPYKEWTECFRGRFGFQRTEAALRARHIALGVDADTSTTVHWTNDDLNFVRELMPLNLRHTEICERFWKEFGTERSQSSINRKYQIMKEYPRFMANHPAQENSSGGRLMNTNLSWNGLVG